MTTTFPLGDLPSTFDCPVVEGGDPVLETLLRARKRYTTGDSRRCYVSNEGHCCAVGACIAVDGGVAPSRLKRKFVKAMLKHEQYLKATTIEAIQLLEAEARRRHPVRSLFPTGWSGHLERINQRNQHSGPEILSIYDAAIARRQGSVQK